MVDIVKAVAPARRIESSVYDARAEAARIIAAARTEAERLLGDAHAGAERVRDAARESGREQGLSQACEAVTWAAVERDRLLASAEPALVRLALGIAGRIVRLEGERSNAVALEMARRAIAEARERTCVALRAHPADLEALRGSEQLAQLAPCARGVAWISDPAIERGGVVVETEAGSIDATLAAQLDVLGRLLTGERP